jgi:UDPglucose--hexose-1-phosphate uridylyltransferase
VADFTFIKIPNLKTWVISAPKRARRPRILKKKVAFCPFCPGQEKKEPELYRIGGEYPDTNWRVRVIPNKFPFAPIHELVIHSPQHHTHLSDVSLDQVRMILETYVNRYNTHKHAGSVVIFRNVGHDAGESVGHAHSQIAVVPKNIPIEVPKLEKDLSYYGEHFRVGDHFSLICPPYSQWPDEVWIVPRERGRTFGEIQYTELESLAYVLRQLVRILNIRHGHSFPNNYYIYPYNDWYLRLTPRAKILGGFEIATGIYVDTQDPKETMQFIKTHFYSEDEEVIGKSPANYRKGA